MTSPLHGEGHQFEREAEELFSESLVGPIIFFFFCGAKAFKLSVVFAFVRGCGLVVEYDLAKVVTRVRFPAAAWVVLEMVIEIVE